MSEWKSFCLGDLATFKYGKMPDKKKVSDLGKYPVYSGYRYVGYYDEYNIEAGQLIIVARGVGGTGDVKLTKEKCWLTNLSIAAKILDYEKVIPQYLYYLFKINNLRYLDSGSAQSQITIFDLERVKVNLPPLETQKKIAAVLSALDDKIELNNAINKNIEEQAQTIFDNFFYDKWNNGNFSVSSLDKIAEYLNGLAMQKFRPKENETGLPVLKIKELRQGFCDKESDSCSERIKPEFIIHAGDVIFSWSGTLLIDFWCGGLCGLNQHLFKVTSKSYGKWFYYLWTKYHLKRFIKLANDMATTMGHIKRKALTDSKVLIPDRENYLRLEKILQPICDEIIANRLENKNLGELRDTLLPRLMSGEIDVSAVEI